MRYRKLPIVVEAVQWTGDIGVFDPWRRAGYDLPFTIVRPFGTDCSIKIKTLEGEMEARPMDWIIKDVTGEFYPCKPEIFAAKYEPEP